MPSGMPVATMAVDGAKNGALFAVKLEADFQQRIGDMYSIAKIWLTKY